MSGAHAQAQPPVAAASDPENVVEAGPASPGKQATSSDPNIDRGFLLPTAMTQSAGSVTYNNYELLLHGVTYGITDRVQASITVLSPIVKDIPFIGFGSVKARLLATDRFHLAVQGTLGWGHAFDVDPGQDANIYSLGAGALASVCLRDDCSSLASASATYTLGFAGGVEDRAHMVIYGGSIVHRVASHVKLLGEVATAAGRTSSNDFDNLDGVLVGYGVRFHTENIGADLGFLRPVATDGGDDGLLLGLPFASVSYRWQ